MYNTSQCSRGIPNKSDSEQKQDNFYYSSPKAATDMGVSSSESHDLTAFYEMLTASFGALSQNTGFYPSLDRIVETTLGPLNLGPGGRSYNEPISHLHCTNLVKKDPHSSLCFNCGKPGHITKVCRGPHTQNIWNIDAAMTPRLTPEDLQLLIESARTVMVSSAPMMPLHELEGERTPGEEGF